MGTPTIETVRVRGATLHCEVRGQGPALLCIPGGTGDAGSFAALATVLADRYTVITYDRRGFVRSPLDTPPRQCRPDDTQRLDDDVADARHLVDALAGGDATVLGSSSGAIVALHLLARDPRGLRSVVVHEPPLVTVLDDGDRLLRALDGVHERLHSDGFEAAMDEFSGLTGVAVGGPPGRPDPRQLPPQMLQMLLRIRRNLEFWIEHELRQYPRATPDLASLGAAADRLVLASGVDSHGRFTYEVNRVLAGRFGLPLVDLPGGHTGYVDHPVDFAIELGHALVPSA
jgi:pimeloyl-ACP methyl ester carboxylesterase